LRTWVVISGIVFVIGNATWRLVHEPKLFWLPLGIFLWALVLYVVKVPRNASPIMRYSLIYLVLLASGNIVKQAFYDNGILQINDYVLGGILTIVLLILIAWEIVKRHYGTK
jgi:hypothetical protein